MAISPLYIPLFTLEEVILDKDTGLPLSGGIVKFYEDAQRTTPKAIFQISGVSPNYSFTNVGNTFVLGINGAFVDINGNDFVPYAYPYDADGNVELYFVTVVSAGLVPQFTREAVPYLGDSVDPGQEMQSTDNALSNPQFVEVNFPGTAAVTFSVTGTNTVTPIAPGWDLITSGSDNITVQQLQPTSANVPTNPPYSLSINAGSNLGTNITLRQRLYNSPSFMRGEFASGSLTVAILGGGAANVSMQYAPSIGTPISIIPNTAVTNDGAYHTIENNVAIPQQINDPADTGYVDILVTIPTSRTIAITSLQVVPVPDAINIPFDEQTAARQKDHLFHYYEPKLIYKPIPSYLVGWDFPLNPTQIFGSTVTAKSFGANGAGYIWDQTIVFQEVDSTLTYVRDTTTGGFLIFDNATASRFAVMQYLSGNEVFDILNQRLAVKLKGSIVTGTIRGTVTLAWAAAATPFVPALPASAITAISTVDSIPGVPALSAGWTALPNDNNKTSLTFTLTSTDTVIDFTGFDPTTVNTTTATAFVIIVAFDLLTPANSVTLDYVSLNGGDIATRPAPQTPDEVLRECQYYYETSYATGVPFEDPDLNGAQFISLPVVPNSTPFTTCYTKSIFQKFKQTKRTNSPVITFCTPNGTLNNIQVGVNDYNATPIVLPTNYAISKYDQVSLSSDSAAYTNNSGATAIYFAAGSVDSYEGYIRYHYKCDARLGIV